jgi:hypothetical protein
MKRNRMFTAFALAVVVALTLLVEAQTAVKQRLTGVVTDSMCGAKHMIAGRTDAECTRICVKQGMQYALLVGDKLYTLQGDTAAIDKYAGQRATATGTVDGNTVKVDMIKSALAKTT